MQSSVGAVEIRRNIQTDNISLVEVDEDTYSSREYDNYINHLVSTLNEDLENYMFLEAALVDAINESIQLSNAKPRITLEKFEKLEKCNDITNCSICFENIKDNVKLKCGHIYCSVCIKKWLTERSNTCPTCREEI
jgi:hypothetical protein